MTVGYKEEKIYKDKGIAADAVPLEDTNFKKMLAGRIDVYQTSKVVGYSTIAKLFTPEEAKLFTNHPTPVKQAEYFILFSKKTPNGKALADKFDTGMKKLKDSGAYKKILAEYGV
ncbi:MAG: transporter substrate-binding domain-containing protein [Xanthomonadaceae bacterium]|nr:transporter substrate-binding domain-containing protein [Xanthomonadaceae bacterium]